ncbi:hypothetical protein [Crystallibacter crystallopoietes]|uniref:hypothetical protein n=1 Tax=Crystallibacter crystallopoietes TaxID=37928 RepID=UPI00030427B8
MPTGSFSSHGRPRGGRILLLVLCWTAAIAALLAGTSAATAAPVRGGGDDLLGNDISWPQCNKALPEGQAFGIVGVNGGLANNTNPCFAEQLDWAEQSTGGTGQPLVALYVNTANPGHAGTWWPVSN